MFLINSRLGLFTATTSRWHPLFRSYGVNMPSSLTTLLPLALGSSPHLPVSVCGTGAPDIPYAFSRHSLLLLPYCNFQSLSPGATNARVPLPQHVSVLKLRRLRILYRMCIDYAFRPRLSSRLTRGGRTYPRKPQIFGHYDSHAILATHSGILTPMQSTCASAHASPRIRRSPTDLSIPKLRLYALAPLNLRRSITRPVSYYALF